MATVVVRRPMRRPAPELPTGELLLDAPPEIPEPGGRQWTQALMVLPMVAMMGAMLLMFSGTASGPIRFVIFGLFGVAMVGMVIMSIVNSGGPGKREMGNARRGYLRRITQQRVRLNRSIGKQRDALVYLHPEPESLWALAASYRLWERRRDDADFGVTRIGTGPQQPAITLIPPDTQPLERLEPLSALALRRFVSTYAEVPGLPLAISVTGFARIYLPGDRDRSAAMVRAVLAQLATFHAPDDLRIAVCAGDDVLAEWEWLKWLPHALHPERIDALGPLRLVAGTITAIEAMLDDVLAGRPRFDPAGDGSPTGPHLVVVVDGGSTAGADHLINGAGVEGVTILDLTTEPPRALDTSAVVLDVDATGAVSGETIDGTTPLGQADALDVPVVEGIARQLAPLRLTAGQLGDAPLSAELGLAELLDLGDPYSFDPRTTWVQRPNRNRLRIQLGIRPDGTPIEVDLKESAQDGMGPHGLLIGATGSGKSELLRTLVLGLAVTHPPNSLNFALVDFKGGATFSRLDKLPHTSAVITNLADELHLVDRMTDAINGELLRRQELLRAAGNYSSLRDYEKARAAGAPLAEVPTLLVVCDEFSELLTARPDFIEMFVQIGRVGRSLGVHLLLASQRLDEGRLRGLDAHLSFRLCLRTFSDMDSRAVLGVGDAFRLPRAPGHGFLKSGTEPMERFRAAYVSGVHRRLDGLALPAGNPGIQLLDYGTGYLAPAIDEDEPDRTTEADDEAIGESLLDILVDRLTGQGTPAHQVWLPPLDASPPLPEILPPLVEHPVRGLTAQAPELAGALQAVIGIVDRPLDQRREPLLLDLSAGAGHVAVVGGPQSGKSVTLATIVCSLALTHTPAEVQFYCLDFGGGTLGPLRNLPHVGLVAGRQDVNAVRRAVAEVSGLLARRERAFAADQVDGIAAFRRLRRDGALDGEPYGDVFLVIDGWLTLRNDFDDLEAVVADIAARGLAYGVHVVISCARWFDLRTNIRDLCGSRLELRLGDPTDSMLDRRAAVAVPIDAPGRGITATKHQFLAALPTLDTSYDELGSGLADLVAEVRAKWRGEPAPVVRLLPAEVDYHTLDGESSREHGLAVGIAERDLGPVRLDFATDANLLLLGDSGSGKTAFLRNLASRIMAAYSPDEARIVAIDHRRGLLGTVEGEHLLGYGTNPAVSKNLIAEVAAAISERMPGADVTSAQLRDKSWWHGPEVFVLVDDYDMIATSPDHPLMPLLPLLAQASDLGLHVILTRRTGGAGRGIFEPFLSRLREVGAPGLLMSGDRDEGPLIAGRRPQVLPPGRGYLADRRGGVQLIQLAWLPQPF